MHAGSRIDSEITRHDFVAYREQWPGWYNYSGIGNHASNQIRYGQLHAIVRGRHKGDRKGCVALIRELRPCRPEPGNELFVEKYEMRRLEYVLSSTLDYELSVLPISHVIHRVIAVPDIYTMTRLYGPEFRMCSVPKSGEEKLNSKYFVPVKVTSFVEAHG